LKETGALKTLVALACLHQVNVVQKRFFEHFFVLYGSLTVWVLLIKIAEEFVVGENHTSTSCVEGGVSFGSIITVNSFLTNQVVVIIIGFEILLKLGFNSFLSLSNV